MHLHPGYNPKVQLALSVCLQLLLMYVLYPFDWPPCRDPARQVSASPASINVLPEYGSDPRTADKLLDGEGV